MLDHKELLYCDSAAAMPMLPEVRSWLIEQFSSNNCKNFAPNLSSDHAVAEIFKKEYQAATEDFFESVQCAPSEWFWTSGATESNEWALQIALASSPMVNTLLLHPLSHPSLSESAIRMTQKNSLKLVIMPLKKDGSYAIDWSTIQKEHELKNCIVAMPYGDHELGSLESNWGSLFECGWVHWDAAQSFAKIPANFKKWPCVSMSCSSSKIGGLSGLGGLFVRLRPRKTIVPLFVGGSQQNALRAGTLPFWAIIAFCKAYIAWQSQSYSHKIEKTRNTIEKALLQKELVVIHTPNIARLPHVLTLSIKDLEPKTIDRLKTRLAFSQGSACSQGQGSEALLQAGFAFEQQRRMMRLGFSLENQNQIEPILETLQTVLHA